MKPFVPALIAALACPIVASAQPAPDHLKCYKVKDSQPKAAYTADLEGLTVEPGCLIKVPGNLLCVETTKSTVPPPPPGGGDASVPAGRFLCYKVKCPKAVLAPVQWQDQFGARVLTPKVAKMLCAPEIVPATTTTTAAAPTTTSTDAETTSTTTTLTPTTTSTVLTETTTSSTTTTIPLVCEPATADCDGDAGTGCECAGNLCCAGACEPPHTNGLGQSFDSCEALGTPGVEATYSLSLATSARAAWPSPGSDSSGDCGSGGNASACIARATGTSCAVWCYTKSLAGYVHLNAASTTCSCPTAGVDPQWQ